MQEVTTPNGNKFRIRPLTQAMSERASRQLQAEGVKLQGNNSLMHENIDFAAELARQAIDSWQGPEGNEPVAGMLPKVARKVIKETPGLFDMIIAVATKQAEQEAEGVEGRPGKLREFVRLAHDSRETKQDNCELCRATGRSLYKAEGICLRTKTLDCWRKAVRGQANEIVASLPWQAKAALRLWEACSTQWRISFSGAIGLDYVAVKTVAEAIDLHVDEKVLDALRALEREQLEAWERDRQATEAVRPKGRQ